VAKRNVEEGCAERFPPVLQGFSHCCGWFSASEKGWMGWSIQS